MSREEDNKRNEPFKDIEFIGLKVALKVILLGSLLFLSVFLTVSIFGSIFGTGITDDVDYTLSNNQIFYTDDDFYQDFNQTWNLRNETEITGIYNATYSFTEDPIAQNVSDTIDFISVDNSDYEELSVNISVIPEYNGHDKVLELTDLFDDGRVFFEKDLNIALANDTHEFWVAKNDTSSDNGFYIRFLENTTTVITDLRFNFDDVEYLDGGFQTLKENFTTSGRWAYFRIVFNDSVNTFDVYIDNVLEGDDLSYNANTVIGVDSFSIRTDTGDYNYKCYLDAWNTPNRPVGDYDATYTFRDDSIGSNPADWTVNENGGTVNVIRDIGEHTKIVEIYDNNGSQRCGMSNNFSSNQTSGTVEFWLRTTDRSKDQQLFLRYGSTQVIGIRIDNNFIMARGSAGWEMIDSAVNNQWYHFRIDFEFTANNYSGLAEDSWELYIDSVKITAITGTFDNPADAVDNLNIFTSVSDSNYYSYWDAFGYTWENYVIGDNLNPLSQHQLGEGINPLINTYDTLEVDRWEFALEGLDDRHELGDDDPEDWTDKNEGYDGVNVANDIAPYTPIYDLSVEIDTTTEVSQVVWGIYRSFSEGTGVYNITYGIYIDDISSTLDYVNCEILSSDTTSIINVGFVRHNFTNVGFEYWNGSALINLADNLLLDNRYDVNIYANNYHNWFEVMLFQEGAYVDTYRIPYNVPFKSGISRINLYGQMGAVGSDIVVYYDYCGVYESGRSIYPLFGFAEIRYITEFDIPTDDGFSRWDLERHNLMRFNATGEFSIHKWEIGGDWGLYYYVIADYPPFISEQLREIESENTYEGVQTANVYDSKSDFMTYGFTSVVFYLEGTDDFSLSSMIIEGVRLDNHALIFTHNGIDVNENYFYVENGTNTMRWTLDTDSAPTTEYIQAEFDITNQLTINASARFVGAHGGLTEGLFRVNYVGSTSTLISIRTYTIPVNFLLPPSRTIESFIILATDGGADITESATGHITEISLRFLPNYGVTVTTLSLVQILIPILVLMIPTALFHKRFGRNAVIPSLFLMSLVCVATQLIPVWVFFIMIVGFATILFIERKKGGLDEE